MQLTNNLNLAVAFATCGVEVTIQKMVGLATGKSTRGERHVSHELKSFELADCNKVNDPLPDLTGADMQQAETWLKLCYPTTLAFRTGAIKAQLDRGYLAKIKSGLQPLEDVEPLHPMLDCLIGLGIREKLLTYMNKGERFRTAPVPGVPRALYVSGQQDHRTPGLRVSNLGMATALIRMGVAVLDCTGPEGSRQLIMSAHGEALHGIGELDALTLAQGLASGSLARQCPGHPAVWVMMAVENRNRMLANIKHQRTQLLLHDPRSLAWQTHHRSAVIYEGDKPAAWQKAQEHLRAV
jgi:hypothetical protein